MFDLVLQNGTIYDGSGTPSYRGDVALQGDRIAALGAPGTLEGKTVIDASGLAVAPGFINMLSWSVESLIADGLSQSEIRQGVTLEVMGEGTSMGPLSDEMKKSGARTILGNEDIEYDVTWTTLGEYLEFLEQKGVSCNVTSFVGSATLRIHAMGYEDRPPTAAELDHMRGLLDQAMREGAVGMSAALIYPPATFQQTDELIELAKVVAQHDGMYISHIRSEGWFFEQAADELIRISREANIRAEFYHLKAAGRENWDKMDTVIGKIEAARAAGAAGHSRYVPLSGGRHRLERLAAPLGTRRRTRRHAGAAQRPGNARANHRGDAHAVGRVGEHVAGSRVAGADFAGGLPH